MKLQSLLFVCCLSLMSSLFADSRHVHPKADTNQAKVDTKNAMLPGFCQIEIINSSFDNVTVYGTFDDGTPLIPFNVYSFESPHYISLYYYNYCHRNMYLDIVTFSGYHIYSSYTRTESTIRIVPYLANQIKAELHTK